PLNLSCQALRRVRGPGKVCLSGVRDPNLKPLFSRAHASLSLPTELRPFRNTSHLAWPKEMSVVPKA
ncbi:hypothetical protein scyTo_0017624, partial [Scyliorhinus torazame]|nr:hypothetical protein [Scyliorhinus torazame]